MYHAKIVDTECDRSELILNMDDGMCALSAAKAWFYEHHSDRTILRIDLYKAYPCDDDDVLVLHDKIDMVDYMLDGYQWTE